MIQPREQRVVEAATGGALAGAVAGYLGGDQINAGQLLNNILLAAGIGAGAALVALVVLALWLKQGWRESLGVAWWVVPGCAVLCALVMACKEILDRAIGWAFVGLAGGWRSALLGGLCGAVLLGGFSLFVSRPRQKRTESEQHTTTKCAADDSA